MYDGIGGHDDRYTLHIIGHPALFERIDQIILTLLFVSVCQMNVHKRCKGNVANTCGINPRLMADILHDMGMSVGKLSLPKGKEKTKKAHVAAGDCSGGGSESDADLEAKLEDLKIAAQMEMDKKMQERLGNGPNAPRSVKKGAGVGEKEKPGLTSLQEMVEKQAGTHKSSLVDFR